MGYKSPFYLVQIDTGSAYGGFLLEKSILTCGVPTIWNILELYIYSEHSTEEEDTGFFGAWRKSAFIISADRCGHWGLQAPLGWKVAAPLGCVPLYII